MLTRDNVGRYGAIGGELNAAIGSKNFSEVIFWRLAMYGVVYAAVSFALLCILQGHAPEAGVVG